MKKPALQTSDWTVGVRVWIERGGRALLGKGRLELLEGIDRWHSISAAARRLNVSYRQAWLLVRSVNEAAGEPLVVAATGGSQGGGARLTPLGRWAVTVFRDLQERLEQTASSLLPQVLESKDLESVHVAAAVSLEEVLGQLLADFAARRPDVPVRVIFGASDELANHLLAGAAADLFLTADTGQLDRLEAAQLLRPGPRPIFAENSLAAIGRSEGLIPVRKPADLARADVRRIALAGPSSPLGRYTRVYLKNLSLYQVLLPRAIQVDNSRAVLSAVRAGQADVGLVYGSDAVNAPGCQRLFQVRRAPSAIQYAAAVLARGRQPERAKTLLDFLLARPAASRFRRCGFFPVRGQGARQP